MQALRRMSRHLLTLLTMALVAGPSMARQGVGPGRGRAAPKAAPGRERPRADPQAPAGRWLGQDGRDLVGPSSVVAPSDVQDIHLAIAGLPRNAVITSAKVTALGGGEWLYKGPHGPWAAQIERQPGSPHADLFLEPDQVETGRPFQVLFQFDDGRKLEVHVRGGRADPNLRVEGAAMTARWAGQGREDRVGVGPSVGPDGVLDAKISLAKLSKTIAIRGVVVSGPDGARWQSGVNPKGFASAELVRSGDDPSRADLFLAFDRDPKGQALAITVHYANEKVDAAKVVAGGFDPGKKAPAGVVPSLASIDVASRWLGQDGTDRVGPGDVHVEIEGLPSSPIVAAALSDPSRGLWAAEMSDKLPFDPGPYASPMSLKRRADPAIADLHFPPFRDETGGTMLLRIAFEDGRTLLARFPGGKADPGLRASSRPSKDAVTARPGDDLNDLARRFGTIRLAPGRHLLNGPLVLEKPVTIAGEGGATLAFSQAADAPTWTAAIKIHSGHTTLENFAVRFDSPIRWTPGVGGGPAVIGATDDKDPGPGDLKADLNFRKLDLEGPPPSGKWDEAPRLIRLGRAVCGAIEGNTLRGGAIELAGGPWRIVDNTYRGTAPGTFAYSVISAHDPHDLVVKGNTARPVAGSGKTWRFLVMTGSGQDDLVEGNSVANVGPRDDDTTPGDNAPEIILTESYSLHFEGKPSAVSADGRVLVVPFLQGEPARTGDVVAILTGPGAGQWRKIAQAMGPTTYLLDAPLPKGEPVVSIATGFVRETFRGNTIDARGGSVAASLVLAGNLFGLTVAENHLIGGGGPFRIVAAASESPVHWGWSHAPLMGATIEDNVIEDALGGGTLCVEHSKAVKTSRGRVYGSATLRGNTYRWGEAFSAKNAKTPAAITLGDPGSLDPSELVVTQENDRIEGRAPGTVRVVGAKLNGRETRGQTLALPTSPAPTAGAGRAGARR